MLPKCLLLTPVFLIFSQRRQAQLLNIEQEKMEKDTAELFLGNLSFTLNVIQQGAKFADFNWVNDVVYLSEKHAYIAITDIDFIKADKERVISDAYLHGRVNFRRKKSVGYDAFAQYQYDLSRGLEDRVITGTGGRFKIKGGDHFTLLFGPGIMYEKEQWRTPVDTGLVKTFQYLKTSSYLSVQEKLAENVDLYAVFYYQARLDRFAQHRVTGEANVNFKINKHLNLLMKANVLYDEKPVVPINKLVYSYTTGITVSF